MIKELLLLLLECVEKTGNPIIYGDAGVWYRQCAQQWELHKVVLNRYRQTTALTLATCARAELL